MTTESVYKKLSYILLEAAPTSTLRASNKARKLGLVPVGVALYAPMAHATQDQQNYMWKLKDGFYATHKIKDGNLVEIPPDEQDSKSSIDSSKNTTQQINTPEPDEEKDVFSPTPVEKVDLTPMDFLERVKTINNLMQGNEDKAKEMAISLINDYDLYVQGDDYSSLRSTRHKVANFPGGRQIYRPGAGKDPLKNAVKSLGTALEKLGLLPKKESAISPLSPSDALKRNKTDSMYGIGQKKVKAEKNSDGVVDKIVFQWADKEYALEINEDVDSTETAVIKLEQPLSETDEAFSKRKAGFRRYSDTWKKIYEAAKKKYPDLTDSTIHHYADIMYGRHVTRNKIIRALGEMTASNGHMNASVFYGEDQDVIEIGSLLKGKILKLGLQNEDRLEVEKFIDETTTALVASDKNKTNVNKQLEELWTELTHKNIKGLAKHYPALVECLTGLREVLHGKIVVFPDDPTHALGDCYAIAKDDKHKGSNNGIAVNSEIEMWNVKMGAGAASSFEKRIQMSVYKEFSYENSKGQQIDVSSFEVQDDLVEMVSSNMFNDIFNDCDNEKIDTVMSTVDKYYDKYKDIILNEYGYVSSGMSASAKKSSLSKIRMCLRQGVRPDVNQICSSNTSLSQNKREASAWGMYRELMFLTEAINNNLVVAQQFKSLIWKEDKIIECDATREDEGVDSSPYMAGALANLSPGKVRSRCADGAMIPQAKFQARTVPIEKM